MSAAIRDFNFYFFFFVSTIHGWEMHSVIVGGSMELNALNEVHERQGDGSKWRRRRVKGKTEIDR